MSCPCSHEPLLLLAREWSVWILDIFTPLVRESSVLLWIVMPAQDTKWLGFKNWDPWFMILRFGTSWKFLDKPSVKVVVHTEVSLVFLYLVPSDWTVFLLLYSVITFCASMLTVDFSPYYKHCINIIVIMPSLLFILFHVSSTYILPQLFSPVGVSTIPHYL